MMITPRITFNILLSLAFAISCGAARADVPTDATLRAQVIGRWQELRDLGCETHQQVMNMRANGTFQVDGVIRACTEVRHFVWKGTWSVRDGKMKYKTTYSFPKDEYPIGEEWEDEIVFISSTEWIMREQSTGNESHAFKIK